MVRFLQAYSFMFLFSNFAILKRLPLACDSALYTIFLAMLVIVFNLQHRGFQPNSGAKISALIAIQPCTNETQDILTTQPFNESRSLKTAEHF